MTELQLSPRRHIVHVVESFAGGTLSVLTQLVALQVHDGHQVSVLHGLRPDTPDNWRELFDPAVRLIHVPMCRSINPLQDWRAYRALRGWLGELAPDVVHLHSSKAGALGRLAARRVLPQARWLFSPHGLSFLQREAGWLKNTIFLVLEKLLARIPVTFAACSDSEAAKVRRVLGARALTLANAVDAASLPQATGGGDRVRIGMAGRVTTARNPELFAAIAQRMTQPGVEFVWIGGGDASGEAALRAAGVTLTGWLTRAQSIAQLATLDVYLQTSRWEGMPMAVLEALGCGLPVLASDIDGNRDLIEPGVNGWLCRDADDFIARLALLLDDAAQRREQGAKARERVTARHSLAGLRAAMYAAYQIGPAR